MKEATIYPTNIKINIITIDNHTMLNFCTITYSDDIDLQYLYSTIRFYY
jgi:hypothetical protein